MQAASAMVHRDDMVVTSAAREAPRRDQDKRHAERARRKNETSGTDGRDRPQGARRRPAAGASPRPSSKHAALIAMADAIVARTSTTILAANAIDMKNGEEAGLVAVRSSTG